MRIVFSWILVCLFSLSGVQAQQSDLAVALMRSTCLITDAEEKAPPTTGGTGLVVARPAKFNANRNLRVLVTAQSVLESIKSDTATLHARRIKNKTFDLTPIAVAIRANGKELWSRYAEYPNLAMLVFELPTGMDEWGVATEQFLTDDALRTCEIMPGETFYTLGFPQFTSANTLEFPLLRTGTLASYPVLRAESGATCLLNLEVLPGSVGSPVYLSKDNPVYGGTVHPGTFEGVLGMVMEPAVSAGGAPLKMAVVVHASILKEAIDALPEPEPQTRGIRQLREMRKQLDKQKEEAAARRDKAQE
jgi:hypothetical protein